MGEGVKSLPVIVGTSFKREFGILDHSRMQPIQFAHEIRRGNFKLGHYALDGYIDLCRELS
jgi:hypothetical protein